MDCYKHQKRVPMKPYLVGDAVAPVDDVDNNDDEEIVSSQSAGQNGNENVELANYGMHNFPHYC